MTSVDVTRSDIIRDWLSPKSAIAVGTLVVCVILAFGTVRNDIDVAKQRIAGHETRLAGLEKTTELMRLETERANTALEKRLAEISTIKAQLVEIDRNIQRLLAQQNGR